MTFNDINQAKLLSNAFSGSVVKDIAMDKKSKKLYEILLRANLLDFIRNKTYAELFEYIYDLLLCNYRNEYIYKNAIASKIAIGRHKLADIAYFSEFNAWNSIADVVIANGTTTAYEIKTEYDSFNRLDSQLNSYQEIFDRVYVIIPEPKLSSLINLIELNIGVIILTEEYTLSTYREAQSNVELLSHKKIYSCLRKNEYENIIVKHYGALPNTKPAFIRKESFKLFAQLDNHVLHSEFTKCLKNRQLDDKSKKLVRALPKPLVSLAMTSNLIFSNLERFALNLEERVLL
jgi:hypothetical protein